MKIGLIRWCFVSFLNLPYECFVHLGDRAGHEKCCRAPDNLRSSHSEFLCYDARVCAQLLSHVWLFATPQTVAHQAPLSMGFSGQEFWSGLPFSSREDVSNPGIEPRSPALQVDSLLSKLQGREHTVKRPSLNASSAPSIEFRGLP